MTISSLIGNITTMKESQTIKIWRSTLRNLRGLYAVTGRPMVEILDELVTKEAKKYVEKGDRLDGKDI